MKRAISLFLTVLLLLSPLCMVHSAASYNSELDTSANIVLLMSLDNGAVIFDKNADQKAAPASLTKITTAILVLENCKNLDEVITVKQSSIDAISGTNSSTAGLMPGEQISIRNLLYCLLVKSANEAAVILADYVGGGSVSKFVDMMNEKAEELGVTPVLSIGGYAVAGLSADIMGYAPKLSSEKLAKQLGLSLPDIDMFEINEAFASQSFAVRRDLGLDPEKVNIYGGGISIGHPIGATGCILATKVFYELKRTDKKDAMISMCIGGGQGISMYFTKV